MSITDFVKRAERKSKESINRCYSSIDFLYWELDFVNDLLLRYSNRASGKSFSTRERMIKMAEIRERIPRIYEDINYYKQCINYDRKEMKRIHQTYGYPSTSERYQSNSSEYDNYNDDDNYSYNEEEEEESIYKYNPVTDTWE